MPEPVNLVQIRDLISKGSHSRVIELLEPFYLDKTPVFDHQLQIFLATSYLQQAQYEKLATLIEMVINDPEVPLEQKLTAYYIAGEGCLKQGHFERAQSHILHIYQLAGAVHVSKVIEAKMLEAKIQQLTNNVQNGIDILEKALVQYDIPDNNELRLRVFGNLGMLHGFSGNHQKAIINFKEVLKIAVAINNPRHQGVTLINLAVAYTSLGDFDRAYDYITKAKRLAQEQNDQYNALISSMKLGELYIATSNLKDAKNELEGALKVSQDLGIKHQEIAIATSLVRLYLLMGYYREARELVDHNLREAEEIKHKHLLIGLYANSALLEMHYGNVQSAIDLISKVIHLQEEAELEQGLIDHYVYMVEWSCLVGLVDEAKLTYDKLRSYIGRSAHPEQKKWLELTQSFILLAEDDLGSARNKLKRFIEEVTGNDQQIQQVRAFLRLANILLKISLFKDRQKLVDDSYTYITQALEMATKIDDFASVVESSLVKASMDQAQKRPNEARETLLNALELAKDKGSKKYIDRIERRLVELSSMSEARSGVLQHSTVRSVISGIDEMLSYSDPMLRLEGGERVFSNVLFFMNDEMGPTLFFFETEIDETLALQSGAFLYTAVGQGGSYRKGLFGPMPFGEENVALVYSNSVPDSMAREIDPRFGDYNYLLVVLESAEGKSHLVNRAKLKALLDVKFKEIVDFRETTEEYWEGLIQEIRAMT